MNFQKLVEKITYSDRAFSRLCFFLENSKDSKEKISIISLLNPGTFIIYNKVSIILMIFIQPLNIYLTKLLYELSLRIAFISIFVINIITFLLIFVVISKMFRSEYLFLTKNIEINCKIIYIPTVLLNLWAIVMIYILFQKTKSIFMSFDSNIVVDESDFYFSFSIFISVLVFLISCFCSFNFSTYFAVKLVVSRKGANK